MAIKKLSTVLKTIKSSFYKLIIIFFVVCNVSCNKKKDSYISVNETNKNVFTSTKLIPDTHFLGDETCKTCHAEEHVKWEGSHHDKAMQIASDSTVLGNFNDIEFVSQGVTSKFYKKGKDYFVNTEGPDGKYHDYKVIYTYGITPLQQYIVKFPNGHFQCLRTAWDTKKLKWFDLYPKEYILII